jgi:peptide/nickel transport system ATP-binding protein
MSATGKLLDVQQVTVEFHIGDLMGGSRLVAVNDVSFSLEKERPEIFTLAGESGSGKTTLSRLLLNDLQPTRGKVFFEGRDLSTIRKRSEFKEFMKKVQPVFQNPFETFSPLRKVDAYLFDTALNFGMAPDRRAAGEVVHEA